ncbi:MAG: HEPN domain-containing protein [Ignavibacteriales bacterium]|nr:HEPN domain-containing protein [Ignavibacteriales bacterium]
MVKKIPKKKYEINTHKKFFEISNSFYEAGKLAFDFEYYNAAGVLIIHSAIALSDALTIKYSSTKSAGENHYEIIHLIKDVIPYSEDMSKAINHLSRLIDYKTNISYSGDFYSKSDVSKLIKYYERFSIWAKKLF